MKLIDADLLINEMENDLLKIACEDIPLTDVEKKAFSMTSQIFFLLKGMINKQPIIKKSIYGTWINGYTFPDGEYRKCDQCGELIKVVYNAMNYCGHCGADMRKVETKNE
jgi:hypothetical protein